MLERALDKMRCRRLDSRLAVLAIIHLCSDNDDGLCRLSVKRFAQILYRTCPLLSHEINALGLKTRQNPLIETPDEFPKFENAGEEFSRRSLGRKVNVAACVCTRMRPNMLRRCLRAISKLRPPVGAEVSIIASDQPIIHEEVVPERCTYLRSSHARVQVSKGVAMSNVVRNAAGLSREFWSDAAPIRKIFKASFERAGLPYYNPHSIRKTLVKLGEHLCSTPEAFKAWSQNLGHEQAMTTFRSYGSVPQSRQAELIRKLGQPKVSDAELRSKLRALLAASA